MRGLSRHISTATALQGYINGRWPPLPLPCLLRDSLSPRAVEMRPLPPRPDVPPCGTFQGSRVRPHSPAYIAAFSPRPRPTLRVGGRGGGGTPLPTTVAGVARPFAASFFLTSCMACQRAYARASFPRTTILHPSEAVKLLNLCSLIVNNCSIIERSHIVVVFDICQPQLPIILFLPNIGHFVHF